MEAQITRMTNAAQTRVAPGSCTSSSCSSTSLALVPAAMKSAETRTCTENRTSQHFRTSFSKVNRASKPFPILCTYTRVAGFRALLQLNISYMGSERPRNHPRSPFGGVNIDFLITYSNFHCFFPQFFHDSRGSKVDSVS